MSNLKDAAQQALQAMQFAGNAHEFASVAADLEAALADPEQEPVAWMLTGGRDIYHAADFEPDAEGNQHGEWTPLYAAPTPQPEKVPVAWLTSDGERCVTEKTMAKARSDGGAMLSSLSSFTVPAFASPTPRKPVELTESEIAHASASSKACVSVAHGERVAFARAVIAAYEAKNGITGETK